MIRFKLVFLFTLFEIFASCEFCVKMKENMFGLIIKNPIPLELVWSKTNIWKNTRIYQYILKAITTHSSTTEPKSNENTTQNNASGTCNRFGMSSVIRKDIGQRSVSNFTYQKLWSMVDSSTISYWFEKCWDHGEECYLFGSMKIMETLVDART